MSPPDHFPPARSVAQKKKLLADQLSELCHTLDPNSAIWPTDVRNQFNHLYSELSEIDEKRARR